MPPKYRLVIIESPLAGDVEANVAYAKECMRDSLRRGEAPFASHLFYAQPGILDDLVPEERALGIEVGLAWGDAAELTAVYVDRGVSKGMRYGIERAISAKRTVVARSLRGLSDIEMWVALDSASLICPHGRALTRDRLSPCFECRTGRP